MARYSIQSRRSKGCFRMRQKPDVFTLPVLRTSVPSSDHANALFDQPLRVLQFALCEMDAGLGPKQEQLIGATVLLVFLGQR